MDSFVEAIPYALGNKDETKYFSSVGTASKITENGSTKIEVKAFDQFSYGELIGSVMVKMDIEGAELSALEGMRGFIQEYQPYLAICIYHKEEDLYEIPHYLRTIYPGYRFFLRGGWHLECWAVPERHFEA